MKFGKSSKTFDKDWKVANSELSDYQDKLKKQKETIAIKEDVKLFKDGLKTKSERLLIYQKQINDIEKELEDGTTQEYKMASGIPLLITRNLLPIEKSSMRKTLKDLQAEISKIEGDYAPAKTEHSGEIKTSFASEKQEKDFQEFLKKKYNMK
ncbi:MAG: hypothetical protein ACRDCT_07495 [Shewanella sp.]